MKIFKHKEKKERIIMLQFGRGLFSLLILFELLNLLKILNFSLEFTWLGLILTASLAWALLEITAHYYHCRKNRALHWSIWLIILAALCLDASGDFLHFYGIYNWWDQLTHFFSSATICLVIFVIINAFYLDKFKFSLLFKTGRLKLSLLLAAALTLCLTVVYEIEEYIEELLFQTHRLGPGTDTVNDLVFNSLGILLVVILITIYCRITHTRKIFD